MLRGQRIDYVTENEMQPDNDPAWIGYKPTGRSFSFVCIGGPLFRIWIRVPTAFIRWKFENRKRV